MAVFKRGVGQTLAGAVGRVEVLENGQAFLEVRDDRRLDDLARRLGHQAAHAGKLAHLGRRTARARMATSCRSSSSASGGRSVVELDRLDAGHHLVGDLFRALGPGVDDLVVLLALGDQAVIVLLLVFLGERLGVGRPASALVSGITMSSLPNEMPARQAWLKPSAMMRSQKITVSFWPQWR